MKHHPVTLKKIVSCRTSQEVRGLKLRGGSTVDIDVESHLARGAWIETRRISSFWLRSLVAPFMGAWIETTDLPGTRRLPKSHPSWVRGLKHGLDRNWFGHVTVAPFMGAWIETPLTQSRWALRLVAPFMGAWIETRKWTRGIFVSLSHPSWVRGLKHRRPDSYACPGVSHPSWVRG